MWRQCTQQRALSALHLVTRSPSAVFCSTRPRQARASPGCSTRSLLSQPAPRPLSAHPKSRCSCSATHTASVPSTQQPLSSATRHVLWVAAAALIDTTGHVLLSQRSVEDKNNPLRFEFPGGKVERGEAPQTALCRELEEELGITVFPDDCQPLVFSTQRDIGKLASLTLLLFTVRKWSGTPQAREGQPSLVWVSAEQLNEELLSMPSLDIPLLPCVRAAMRTIGQQCEHTHH